LVKKFYVVLLPWVRNREMEYNFFFLYTLYHSVSQSFARSEECECPGGRHSNGVVP
jgi:hypothetical protein